MRTNKKQFNPFQANFSFLHPLWFIDILMEYRTGTLILNVLRDAVNSNSELEDQEVILFDPSLVKLHSHSCVEQKRQSNPEQNPFLHSMGFYSGKKVFSILEKTKHILKSKTARQTRSRFKSVGLEIGWKLLRCILCKILVKHSGATV